jgi:hypothetical protein
MIPTPQTPPDSLPTQRILLPLTISSPDSPSTVNLPTSIHDNALPDDMHPVPLLPRRRPSQLSPAWQTIFQTRLQPNHTQLNTAGYPTRVTQPPIQQTANNPCGSSFTKDYGGLRIWWNNANTLLQHDDFAELHELCLTLREYKVGIVALQEVNLNLNRPEIRTALESVFTEHFGTCKLILATSPCHSPTAWKPGGTLLAILGTWSHAVTHTGQDSLGRWCCATLAGRDGTLTTVYSYYNVVNTTIDQAGPSTIYAQQWQVLRTTGITSPNPRKQCIADLRNELQETRKAGSDIIIIGDFNEEVGRDPDLMASVCAEADLYDVLADLHPDQANTPTYIRGQTRLDYAIISHTLRDRVDAMGHNHYHQFYFSDHRAGFLDLGGHESLRLSSPIAPHSRRHVHSNSPLVSKFVDNTYKHLLQAKVFHKFANFLLDVESSLTPYVLANAIDTQVTYGLLHGDKTCSRPPTHPWSEKLNHASLRVRYWKTYLSDQCHRIDTMESVAVTLSAFEPIPTGPHTQSQAKQHLAKAKQELRAARKHAVAARVAFLSNLKLRIASRKTSTSLDPDAALKMIDKQLYSASGFRRIRRALNKDSCQPLTKVTVTRTQEYLHPDTSERVSSVETEVISSRQALEKAILDRNKKHFAQAQNTPWHRAPLASISSDTHFNLYTDAAGNQIELPSGTFLETATVLAVLKEETAKKHPKWSADVSFEVFISGLLHWKESTSTSPSGRHLGIYKSLVTAYIDSGGEFGIIIDDDGVSIRDKAEEILRVIHGLAAEACKHGFYLNRWRYVINVMIYKKAGSIELDTLRVLHLFEADLNLTVGILFGRRAMHHNVDHQLLHQGQYGRPGGECQDVAFAKILHTHMATYSHTSLGQFESDAASCFDRIVMLFVFAILTAWGAPTPALRMWERTLYHIVHSVKTALGHSTASYEYTPATPIIGPGQGSRGGPAACSIATSPLLTSMDRLAHGISFTDPQQQLFYSACAKMFVDDNTNYSNKFLPWLHTPPEPTVVRDMIQHDAQTWERLLWTSGGLLKLPKCLYYLMIWMFDAEGTACLTPSLDLPSMELSSGDSGLYTEIAQYSCASAHRTLGNWVAPNLQMKTSLLKLQSTASEYSTRMSSSSLSKLDAWISYFAVFLPMMAYTLPVCHHSQTSLDRLQSAPTTSTLLKLGFNRHTAHAVVYGCVQFAGLGLRSLFIEQGIAQILISMRHLRACTDVGTLFLITLQWWQVTAGVSFALLENPNIPLTYLHPDWFTTFRNFLAIIQGSLHIPAVTLSLPTSSRHNDSSIMDIVSSIHGTSAADLRRFNTVRIWMGISHISEITTANGKYITREAWTGTRVRFTPRLWPYQPKPGPISFRVWRRLLADAFLEGHRHRVAENTVDLSLRTILGDWLPGSSWLRSKWSSFYSISLHSIFIYNPVLRHYDSHTASRKFTRRSAFFHVLPSSASTSLPPDAVPVDVQSNSKFLLIGKVHRVIESPTTPIPFTFEDYVASLPAWDYSLIQDLHLPNLDSLLNSLRTDTSLLLCSDGGAADSKGSYGSIIASDDQVLTELSGQAHGANPRSFRAEGYGLLANLRLIHHLMLFYDIPRTSSALTLYCDNQGLLDRLETSSNAKYIKPRRFLFSEADLEMQILDTLQTLDTDVTLCHVKGHQDDTIPTAELPWPAQLNIRCDALASTELRRISNISPIVPFLPASTVSLTVQGKTLTHHIPSQVRQLHSALQQRPYLEKHHKWETGTFDMVNWDLLRSCLTDLSTVVRFFFVKWINLILPFQSQQHKFNQSPSPACPSRCGATIEDASHFLRCSHRERLEIFMALQTRLATVFTNRHLDPYLRRIVWLFMDQYLDIPILPTANLPSRYLTLYHAQRLLGPDSIMFGFFHHDWILIQDDYLKFRKLPNNKNQATSLMKITASIIFGALHELWFLRNSHLHDADGKSLHSYQHSQLLHEIEALYDLAPLMLASDRAIFHYSLDKRQSHNTNQLRNFLSFARPVVKLSIQQAKDMGSRFRPIDEYFRPVIPQHVIDAILGNFSRDPDTEMVPD